MMQKTWDFRPSLMMKEMISELEMQGYFPTGKGRPSGGETVPQLELNEAIVFKDIFVCGLRFPTMAFLWMVLGSFKV